LVSKFFLNNFLDDLEIKIAGDAEERAAMMPLLYLN